MESTVDRPAPDPFESGFLPAIEDDSGLDVPDMLAERISELYASEELHQRKERTDRLLARAAAAS